MSIINNRFTGILISGTLLLLLGPLMIMVSMLVFVFSSGQVIYWSDRIGQNNKVFRMPKFRTMRPSTPQVATHLLVDSKQYMTAIGPFLRQTSLDELPQLWSILCGDMNLIGPRPALFNQEDLIKKRTDLGIHTLKPGVTGWAQVNGRDEISIDEKVNFDLDYLNTQSLTLDLKILAMTLVKVLGRKNIKH